MRRVWLSKEDFGLFHQDISPIEYEFFKSHSGAFKRMWTEQSRRFWALFVNAFEHFIWNYGIMKEFPMTEEEAREYIDEIVFYIRDQFVDGRIATAKALVMDCVVVTQHRNCIAQLDKAVYAQNPFYMKETREIFRQLFGPPTDKKTFMKVLCGLPVYIKFAGAAVACLRRWLSAEIIPSNEKLEMEFLETVYRRPKAEKLSDLSKEDFIRAVGKLEQQSTSSNICKSTISIKVTKIKNSKHVEKKTTEKESVSEVMRQQQQDGGENKDGVKKKRKKKKKKLTSSEQSTSSLGEEGRERGEGGKLECGDQDRCDVGEAISSSEISSDGKSKYQNININPEHTMAVIGVIGNCSDGNDDESICSSPLSVADSGISSIGSTEVATRDVLSSTDVDLTNYDQVKENDGKKRKQLHHCACCGSAETVAKTFKRCQKCRGRPNPNYYCSRECQAKHWKIHRIDHREEATPTNKTTNISTTPVPT